jgi:hypothetical protein
VVPNGVDIFTFSVALSPTPGHEGTKVWVSGSGFGRFKAVDIYLDVKKVALAATDGNGNFTASLRVPEDSRSGGHPVTAVQRFNGVAAQAQFRVLAG